MHPIPTLSTKIPKTAFFGGLCRKGQVESKQLFQRALVMPLILFATYFVSRTDVYRLAALITAFVVFGLATGSALLAGTAQVANAALMYLNLGVLVSSIFLPFGATLLVGLLNVLIVVTLPMVREEFAFSVLIEALIFNILFAPLLVL